MSKVGALLVSSLIHVLSVDTVNVLIDGFRRPGTLRTLQYIENTSIYQKPPCKIILRNLAKIQVRTPELCSIHCFISHKDAKNPCNRK